MSLGPRRMIEAAERTLGPCDGANLRLELGVIEWWANGSQMYLDENEFIITDPGLSDSLCLSKKSRLKAFLALNVGKAGHKGGT